MNGFVDTFLYGDHKSVKVLSNYWKNNWKYIVYCYLVCCMITGLSEILTFSTLLLGFCLRELYLLEARVKWEMKCYIKIWANP